MSVGLSVTLVSPAKTAEPIKISFGLRTGVGPGNRVLDGVQIPVERGNFEGKAMPRHARRHSDVNCAKTAEPIEIPFGLRTLVGIRKHVLARGPDPCAKGQLLGERTCPSYLRTVCSNRLSCRNRISTPVSIRYPWNQQSVMV